MTAPTTTPATSPAVADPLPPILETLLKSLPEGYSNATRSSEELTMGKLSTRNSPWLIEPETPLRFSVIDIWHGARGVGFAHLEFRDVATLERLKPWILLSLGECTAFQKDRELLVVVTSNDDTLTDWVPPVVEKSGYRRVPALHCPEQTERIVSRQGLTLQPGEEKELTVTFVKELMALKVQLVAVARNRAPNKLSAVLSNPGINMDVVSMGEDEDWTLENWRHDSIGNLYPAKGVWKLKFKNSSLFTPARIDGWGVEVVGYSLNSCTAQP